MVIQVEPQGGAVLNTSQSGRQRGSRAQREAAARLLTMCLPEEAAFDAEVAFGLLQRSLPTVFLDAARYHRIGGLVYKRLASLGVTDPLAMELRRMYSDAVHNHMRTLWALSRLQPVLDASGAPWAVVKGPVLAELVYRDPGLRTYSDLDVVVEPASFADVVGALEGAGFKLLDRNWKVIRRESFGEVHLVVDAGILLDLHWSLVTIYRGRTSMSSGEMLERREAVSLGGVPAWSLSAVDQLVHLAVHAALSGGDKLVWLKDIDLAARLPGVNWDLLVERAARWRVTAPVGFMLSRVAATIGTPVPHGLADKLLGRYNAALVKIVDRISPWQHAFGRVTTPSLLLARSIGQGPVGSAGWFIRRSIRNLDPREPEASSAFTPRGTGADRDAFFDAVTRAEPRSERIPAESTPSAGHRGVHQG